MEFSWFPKESIFRLSYIAFCACPGKVWVYARRPLWKNQNNFIFVTPEDEEDKRFAFDVAWGIRCYKMYFIAYCLRK